MDESYVLARACLSSTMDSKVQVCFKALLSQDFGIRLARGVVHHHALSTFAGPRPLRFLATEDEMKNSCWE